MGQSGSASQLTASRLPWLSGHEVPAQILQQGLGICRGELSPSPCWLQDGAGFVPQLHPQRWPLLSRSAGSASSRTWSSQRRWQRTMTTVSRDLWPGSMFFLFVLRENAV